MTRGRALVRPRPRSDPGGQIEPEPRMYIPSHSSPGGLTDRAEGRAEGRGERERFEARLRELDRRLRLAEQLLEPRREAT